MTRPQLLLTLAEYLDVELAGGKDMGLGQQQTRPVLAIAQTRETAPFMSRYL